MGELEFVHMISVAKPEHMTANDHMSHIEAQGSFAASELASKLRAGLHP